MIRRIIAVSVAAAALSGCAVLKSPDPVQMYRFGGGSAFAGTGATSACPDVAVTMRRIEFPEASRGDRVLAYTGAEAAYIKGARWVSPAETLFEESLRNAFVDGAACAVLNNGPARRDGLVLSVDVRRFEATYQVAGAAPSVDVVTLVRLVRPGSERAVVAEDRIVVSQPADANRVSSIIDAFDGAIAETNRQIVVWTDQQAGRAQQSGQLSGAASR